MLSGNCSGGLVSLARCDRCAGPRAKEGDDLRESEQ